MRKGTRRGLNHIKKSSSSHYHQYYRNYAAATNTTKNVTSDNHPKRSDNDYILSPSNMNTRIQQTSYAVRGELVIRADKLKKDLSDPQKKNKYDYDEIIFCNIGNPQELGQKPITYFRQVLALLEYPELANLAPKAFPADVVKRAKLLLDNIPGGTGAYSNSQGLPIVRQNVAKFISDRDGHPSDPEDIFLSDGASPAVQRAINILIRESSDAIMIPIPQYPLYSASIPLYGGSSIPYYLDESNSWNLSLSQLQTSYNSAIQSSLNPRALVIINPGNPTGQSLPVSNMKEIIDFCSKNKLLLLADEVYQVNCYKSPFTSFKKVLRDMGEQYNKFELMSFHSVSKGVTGECGKRGGYVEMIGIHPKVKEELYKLASVSLCSNVVGQIVVDLMVNPPKKGEESFELYNKEVSHNYESLKQRSERMYEALNKLEGVSCNEAEGAMYLFPQITLPKKAVEEAEKNGRKADVHYCVELLENTGICVVPGSGFGQKDGTWHFRTTFLPPDDKLDGVVDRMSRFHAKFMKQYS